MASVGIGERLRSARQALGLSLEEIESVTRIQRAYLAALEQEAFDDLPGPTYVRGFLRAYAAYLGIPPGELLELTPAPRTRAVPPRESPVDVRLTPATRLSPARRVAMGVGILLGLGVVFLGVILYGQVRQFAQTTPPSPARTPAPRAGPSTPSPVRPPGSPGSTPSQSPTPSVAPPPGSGPAPPGPPPAPKGAQPASPTAPPGGAPGSKPPVSPQPGGASPFAPPAPKGSPAPGPSGAAAPAPGAPAAGAPAVPSSAAAPVNVVLVASGTSWVRTVADGTTVFEGFLNAGDKQVWRASRTLTVRVGNAGAVDITLNGRSLGRPGGAGQVYEHTFSAGAPSP